MAMWKLIYPGVRFSELLIYIGAKGMLFHKKIFSAKGKTYKNSYDRQKAEEKFKRHDAPTFDLCCERP